MSFDSGLAERVRDALGRLGERGIREKGLFGGRGFLLGKSVCVAVYEDSLLVKTPPDEYNEVLGIPGVEAFAPGGERPMGTWVVVPDHVVADDPELAEWVARGLRGVRSAPEKKTSKPHSAAGKIQKPTVTKRVAAKVPPPAKKRASVKGTATTKGAISKKPASGGGTVKKPRSKRPRRA